MASDVTLRAVSAHQAFFEETEHKSADDLFRRSALATAAAIDQGATALRLAKLFAASTQGLAALKSNPTYTSDVSVGYHARTGRVLKKPPPAAPISARDLQGLVRTVSTRCGVAAVDQVLSRARSQVEAYDGLQERLQRHSAKAAELALTTAVASVNEKDDLIDLLARVEQLLDQGVDTSNVVGRLQDLAARVAEGHDGRWAGLEDPAQSVMSTPRDR